MARTGTQIGLSRRAPGRPGLRARDKARDDALQCPAAASEPRPQATLRRSQCPGAAPGGGPRVRVTDRIPVARRPGAGASVSRPSWHRPRLRDPRSKMVTAARDPRRGATGPTRVPRGLRHSESGSGPRLVTLAAAAVPHWEAAPQAASESLVMPVAQLASLTRTRVPERVTCTQAGSPGPGLSLRSRSGLGDDSGLLVLSLSASSWAGAAAAAAAPRRA